MFNGGFKTRQQALFANPVRTLSASELDKVVGGGPLENDVEAGKGVSAQDNQGKVMG